MFHFALYKKFSNWDNMRKGKENTQGEAKGLSRKNIQIVRALYCFPLCAFFQGKRNLSSISLHRNFDFRATTMHVIASAKLPESGKSSSKTSFILLIRR